MSTLFMDMDFAFEIPEPKQEVDADAERRREFMNQPVEDLELSVRATNCLKAANIKTIGELVSRDVSTMLKFRNFGRKSSAGAGGGLRGARPQVWYGFGVQS